MFKLDQTPIELFLFKGTQFLIKRDDLLHPQFSGNKARKFKYFLDNDFPGKKQLVGYGSAQANSLYSMAALAQLKYLKLDFYVDHIPRYLKENPKGNYKAALELGANIIATNDIMPNIHPADYIKNYVLPNNDEALFVPEGGRCALAEYGVKGLAKEIADWVEIYQPQNLKVFLPAGTGTTSLFLQKYFREHNINIDVLTCSVVGGDNYLVNQFNELDPSEQYHPILLSLGKKYHFGKCYPEFYQIWKELLDAGMEFELLYDPLGWLVLLDYLKIFPQSQVLYIHQGGLLGNESMIARYRRKLGE